MSVDPERELEDAFSVVLAVVDRFASTEDIREAGGRLVRPLPWVGTHAYLHRLYSPCTEDEVAALATLVGRQPPQQYRRFLMLSNGLSLFHESLSVYGIRESFDRTPSVAQWQPYSVAVENLDRMGLRPDDFCVGSVGPECDKIVWREASDDIARLSREDGVFHESWPSFADFLKSESKRFSQYHESTGHLKEVLPDMQGKAPPCPQDDLSLIRPRSALSLWWDSITGMFRRRD